MFREEIFGPVAPITTFGDEDEAIARANDTEYGLVAYVFTRDLARALRVSEALDFGMVGVNQGIVSNPAAPFGGRQALGLRPRGRLRGHRGVPRDQVRRQRPVRHGVTTVDRSRLAALHAEEEQRFVDLHPTSARLAQEAGEHLLAGVPMPWMTRWPGSFPLFVDRPRAAASPTSTASTTSTCASATPAR